MKFFCNAFAVLMAALCTASTANALPLVWRADWPDCKPCEKLVHRGTDIELQPTWYINGELADSTNWTFTTYVSTNAAPDATWFGPLPGAAFSHTNDIGAAFYNVMVRAQLPGGQVNYTAFARLRMLDSPGFAPGELPLPVPFIDFSKVVALHAPWTLQTDFDAAISTLSDSISTLNDTKASTADATLVNASDWVCSPAEVGGGPVYIAQDLSGAWYPTDCEGSTGAVKGDAQSLSLSWAADDWYGGVALTATRAALGGYVLGSQTDKPLASEAEAATNSAAIATINSKIPSAASQSNQLADKQWIDDEIDTYAAYYITYTAAGAAFPTRAALTNATVVYSGGAARTPTRNDYAVVLADESQGGAEWRYIYTVAVGATSGQWDAQYPIETNDYDALANKPQINGHTLTGNQTGADLGVLDLSGGTVTGNLAIGPNSNYSAKFESDPSGAVSLGLHDGTGNMLYIAGGKLYYQQYDWQAGVELFFPSTDGTLALSSDISAAALAATNYTDASISPTSPAFSNAVLSVGLGIDTNTVAVINELVDSAHDLPVSGATSVGALLLALAAAIAALKRDKADASALHYDCDHVATVSTGTTPTITDIWDRAGNRATLGSTVTAATVTLPAATPGKMRDFYIRLIIQSSAAPTITFYDPATQAAVTSADIPFGASSLADIAPGDNVVLFTEIAANKWLVSVKHEEAAS